MRKWRRPGGWIVRSLEYPVAVACGEPSPAVVARALEERPERFAILFPEPRDDAEEILPVWGAHESNAASMAMAKSLGFVRDARWACYVSPR